METKQNENCTPGGEPAKPGNPLSAETVPRILGGHPSFDQQTGAQKNQTATQPTQKSSSTLQAKLTSSSKHKEKEQNIYSAIASLKSMIKQQYKAVNALLVASEQLGITKDKTKSPVVANAIDQVLESVEALKNSTTSVHGAFYEAEKPT